MAEEGDSIEHGWALLSGLSDLVGSYNGEVETVPIYGIIRVNSDSLSGIATSTIAC